MIIDQQGGPVTPSLYVIQQLKSVLIKKNSSTLDILQTAEEKIMETKRNIYLCLFNPIIISINVSSIPS